MRLTKQLREAIYTDLHDLKFKAPEADLEMLGTCLLRPLPT